MCPTRPISLRNNLFLCNVRCGISHESSVRTTAGCSKRPDFSPAQPRPILHPPALSLPRQPLRPGTRPIPGKAGVAIALRGGWDDPTCARPTRGVCDRALREQRGSSQTPRPLFQHPARLGHGQRTKSNVREGAILEGAFERVVTHRRPGGKQASSYPSYVPREEGEPG